MLFKKQGFPEVSELVLCKVTKVQFHSVFVSLEEYINREGMIHISEISPGRIRNIRDYVREGKVIVCVVLRINQERNQIDLSFRRVNEAMRKNKVNEIKQIQIAEKIIEFVAKKANRQVPEFYKEVVSGLEEYDNPYQFFEDVVADNKMIDQLKQPDEIKKQLLDLIKQRIKLPEVTIQGQFDLKSYESNGIEIIKSIMVKAQEKGGKDVTIAYLGAGKYSIKVKESDYKAAEKVLREIVDFITVGMEKAKSIVRFKRID